MLRAVLPKPGAREIWMLSGASDDTGFGTDGRLPPIEEDWFEEAAEAAASELPEGEQ